jgi:hypothetical protein
VSAGSVTDFGAEIEPFKLPYAVRLVLTTFPFQVMDSTAFGAKTSMVVALTISPVTASFDLAILAPRTR